MVRGSTSSVTCNFGVSASRASCLAMAACLSGLGGPNWAWTRSVTAPITTPNTKKKNTAIVRFMAWISSRKWTSGRDMPGRFCAGSPLDRPEMRPCYTQKQDAVGIICGERTSARPKGGRPLQKQLPPADGGFVDSLFKFKPFLQLGELIRKAASPSRVLRDGEGRFRFK